MRHLLDRLYLVTAWMAALSVFAICALMLFQSLGRELGVKTGGTNDLVAWLCAASAFLAMAHSFKHGDFVRVTLLSEKLGPSARRALELFTLVGQRHARRTPVDPATGIRRGHLGVLHRGAG